MSAIAGYDAGHELGSNPGGFVIKKGFIMQRRVILLFVLFLFTAVFYSTVIRQNLPDIKAKQRAQTEMLNSLDEQVLSQAQSGN